jgi:hypothetical protein
MKLLSQVLHLHSSIRELVAPHYRPELYYMRGPGPAYARRMAMAEPTRQTPQFVDPANMR